VKNRSPTADATKLAKTILIPIKGNKGNDENPKF
jgi:hypothetical protein